MPNVINLISTPVLVNRNRKQFNRQKNKKPIRTEQKLIYYFFSHFTTLCFKLKTTQVSYKHLSMIDYIQALC